MARRVESPVKRVKRKWCSEVGLEKKTSCTIAKKIDTKVVSFSITVNRVSFFFFLLKTVGEHFTMSLRKYFYLLEGRARKKE